MIWKLRKLKGRSLAELTDRGRQTAARWVELAGSADRVLPGDDSFISLFRGLGGASRVDVLERFRREPLRFLPSFKEQEALASDFSAIFPDEARTIISVADRALAGSFDLLGYSDLSFGSSVPDWHFEPVSGNTSPRIHWSRIDAIDASETGDKRILWELNRHQYFVVLGYAYWLTGNEKYTEGFLSHLTDWIVQNPPKIGVNWVSSLEIAYRSIAWITAWHFFRESSRFPSDVFVQMLKCLYINGRHITRHLSTYSSPNTHLTGEALGLYVIGTFLAGIREASEWKATGEHILVDEIDRQVRDDGGYVEQAFHYQRYTADIYLTYLILLTTGGSPISEAIGEQLRKMLHFLMHAMQPNGETPMIGDDDGGGLHFADGSRYSDFRSTLAVGAVLLNDSELKFAAGDASPDLLWLLGTSGLRSFQAIEPRIPEKATVAFPSSGFFMARDGWDRNASSVLIDCGPHGFMNGGHAHSDALSFVLSVHGVPVLIDSGTYTYTGDKKLRDAFRSSAAHNCLLVNGESSSLPRGPFSWHAPADGTLLEWSADQSTAAFRGKHDGYLRFGVEHERMIRFDYGKKLLLTDKVTTTTRNDFDISFVLSPYIEAIILDDLRVVLRQKDAKAALVSITSVVDEASPVPFDGWRLISANISPRYGALVETTRLVFTLTRDRDFSVTNTFVFSEKS